ncbi:c-type cytochrome [Sphingomonas sp. MAH-20]|uniref:C-type cytochrome n=1 Tax=Sphingomonas horti TaxID=2682842 RepID=A0A6I4J3I9_9SPHN|nr:MULTISPECIES: c-type cytochrome [Sphingomonas]MBA2918863.1 c-type cytochrome [Sphingomonas sp. CGMCC 1.13658]MVO78896.1 c-type cytochrome [Sphingomonas horti]
MMILGLALLSGCDREAREVRGKPLPETAVAAQTSTLFPGGGSAGPEDPRAEMYAENAYHISEGGRLYRQMNCVGCHANGGGGMGPALMDDQWRYGGRMDQIVASIDQGRPNGMPSWRGKLTPTQMWQLAAYVRTLSANVPKDAAPSRNDTMSNIYPRTLAEPEPPSASDPAGAKGPAR